MIESKCDVGMKRLLFLAAGFGLVGGYALTKIQPASALNDQSILLVGNIEGVEQDGAFPAVATFRDPDSSSIIYTGKALVEVENGMYKARFREFPERTGQLYQVELEGLEAAEDFEMAGFVNLQDSTPGSVQTGHINISGYVLANRIGLGVSPTIAKVQVNETGAAQGVRSITNTGTAIYGQATAGTGLAAGGYFTTSSVGGRAMVGDALSTTGSTVGGLFYNRSQAGVAVWGRHINGSGDSIGVFGQTASTSGSAVMAQNTGTGDTVSLAGANGSILSSGRMPRHNYSGATASTMVPIAYGLVGDNGDIFTTTGNFSVVRTGVGTYELTITNSTLSFFNTAVMVTAYNGDRIMAAATSGSGNWIIVSKNTAGSFVDSSFQFAAFQTVNYDPPEPPREFFTQYDGLFSKWKSADPVGYQAFKTASEKARFGASAIIPNVIPYDPIIDGIQHQGNRPR